MSHSCQAGELNRVEARDRVGSQALKVALWDFWGPQAFPNQLQVQVGRRRQGAFGTHRPCQVSLRESIWATLS